MNTTDSNHFLNLDQLGLKYGTDKASSFHNYLATYERYLEPMRDQPIHLLEIGVAGGASIRMWRDYFPTGCITGIDHNEQFINSSEAALKKEPDYRRVFLQLGEVSNPDFWRLTANLGPECPSWDVIVDDGGHFSSQIIAAFEGAWPLLRKGGLYFIEDTHAIYQYDDPVKFFGWIEGLLHRQVNEHGANQCGRPTTGDIEWMHFYKSLIIICK